MTLRDPRSVFAAALLVAGCAARETADPVFPLDQCARVPLVDEATGVAIVGAEDLDIDRKSGRIFVSAYDRRKAERAAHEGASSVPEGGVYTIELSALNGGDAARQARPLVDPRLIAGGLRPHGMSYDASNGRLTFINRAYARNGSLWNMQPRIVVVDSAGALIESKTSVECSANDIASSDGRVMLTLDHGACGWRMAVEDILGTRGGRLVDDKGATLVSGLGFANGVVAAPGGDLVVAATRERAVHLFSMLNGEAVLASTARTGAAPDNLTLSDDGHVIAAMHQSLFALGLQRKLGIGRSPSRIAEIDLKAGGQRLLFDDPKSSLVSAATVAVLAQGMLVIGSVIDPGLVVCRGDAANP